MMCQWLMLHIMHLTLRNAWLHQSNHAKATVGPAAAPATSVLCQCPLMPCLLLESDMHVVLTAMTRDTAACRSVTLRLPYTQLECRQLSRKVIKLSPEACGLLLTSCEGSGIECTHVDASRLLLLLLLLQAACPTRHHAWLTSSAAGSTSSPSCPSQAALSWAPQGARAIQFSTKDVSVRVATLYCLDACLVVLCDS
jgi:hypothetical protein